MQSILKQLRDIHGYKIAELADKLDISQSYLSEIENGKKQMSIDILNTLSDIYDTKPSTLIRLMERCEEAEQSEKSPIEIQKMLIQFVADTSCKSPQRTSKPNRPLGFCPTKLECMLVLSNEQITSHPFITKDGQAGFYKFIRSLFDTELYEVDEIDCRHINVAKNIQESWFKYGEENSIDASALAMQICMCGPKALEELPDNTVEIQENCFTFKAKSGTDTEPSTEKQSDQRIKDNETYVFRTNDTDLAKYNQTKVTVLRKLTKDECDIEDVGNMYKVRFEDGYERDVFADELSCEPN